MGAPLKSCIKNKKRQLTHQQVDIKAFRDKIGELGNAWDYQSVIEVKHNSSLHETQRYDMDGVKIAHGEHYKIKFADEVDKTEKTLATTKVVESYKKYNAPT